MRNQFCIQNYFTKSNREVKDSRELADVRHTCSVPGADKTQYDRETVITLV